MGHFQLSLYPLSVLKAVALLLQQLCFARTDPNPYYAHCAPTADLLQVGTVVKVDERQWQQKKKPESDAEKASCC